MEETKSLEAINKLAEILNQSGANIVSEYTTWFAISAFGWIVFGVVVAVASIKFKYKEGWDMPSELFYLLKGLMVLIAAMTLFAHIPDLFAPTGISIHQLIIDIRG